MASNLNREDQKGVRHSDVNFAGETQAMASLRKADLSGANMNGAVLTGHLLEEANLSGADLTDANLSAAHLNGARLIGANLTRANLMGADLRKANLNGADLTDAMTQGANFDGADMRGAIFKTHPTDGQSEPKPEPLDAVTTETHAEGELSDESIEKLLREGPQTTSEAENSYFTYRTRNLAIVMLFSEQIGRKSPDERSRLLDLLVQYNKNFLGIKSHIPMAARGSYIIGGFENPTDALRCSSLYIKILRDMNVDCYVSVSWGIATARMNMNANTHNELIIDSISPAARIQPQANSGEILILEELYANPATNHGLFLFEKVNRKWALSPASTEPSLDVACYRVRPRDNGSQ